MKLPASRVFLLLFLTVPVAACANFKPLRVVAPEFMGLVCTEQGICVDDVNLIPQATALKKDAVAYLEHHVGTFVTVPRMLYCSNTNCAKSYGFSSQVAYTVGSFGIVVGPRGWQPHFVRHELIHHLQVERWGSLRTWLLKPDWLIEGMAYSLSDDPRKPLPEPLQGWRQRFEEWHAASRGDLWTEADKQ